ncbi:hypothetical protein CW751_04020 [Brumimicrobium salinarum]|uniref:DUF420 domain-containing protein n=1 Tax=Brumimicrobium salinarum TaxID=2058658 RepID=A0A2I0R532_9FLAO|nr:DUF420 domain-containing protein [Brumimicrobium salinarum]PKR81701.1 hypothetical protein CW751_04020 [Brumimicrobium salinarum]
MNITIFIIICVLTLSILAPFIAIYAVSFIKMKKYKTHIKIHKWLFWVCIAALLVLEIQIRVAGGSGSLVEGSEYMGTTAFKVLLIAHIIGAVLTYILWGITIFLSNKKWKKRKTLPGGFSITHKRMGIIVIIGLFYIAITAFFVSLFAFFL